MDDMPLAVGKEIGSGDRVFIAAPPKRYDRSKSPLTGRVSHMLIFEQADLPWLIESLTAEIAAEAAGEE